MTSPHRRSRLFAASSGLVVLLPVLAGCSSDDGSADTAVPTPGRQTAALCRDLDRALPERVDGRDRHDPEPRSTLTAGWGDPAIILRCGVPRPEAMDADDSVGGEVNGVGWLVEKQDDGSHRFTTALRRAYVEVTLPKSLAKDGAGPLTDLAPAIRKTIPKGVAD
ncbi:DUF3515 domain-containing protein [Streptomyces sp. NPDC058045]|uniref:DUF3515 domain-containing protein n=1 Tax=Streptomyces sp. NPDC058045 TaxID=3346311 RepID=UPI0036E66EF4